MAVEWKGKTQEETETGPTSFYRISRSCHYFSCCGCLLLMIFILYENLQIHRISTPISNIPYPKKQRTSKHTHIEKEEELNWWTFAHSWKWKKLRLGEKLQVWGGWMEEDMKWCECECGNSSYTLFGVILYNYMHYVFAIRISISTKHKTAQHNTGHETQRLRFIGNGWWKYMKRMGKITR